MKVIYVYIYINIYIYIYTIYALWCLFWPSLFWVALNLARNEVWVVPEILYSLRWRVGVFSTFKKSSSQGIFYDFIVCIRNPARLLRWSFLQKQSTSQLDCFCRNLHLRFLTGFLIHLCDGVYDIT